MSRQKFLGWSLAVVGILIAVFSQQIVFPGLERLFGIETIVGRDNVVYHPDGGYVFTNPGAMVWWISSVAGFGLVIAFIGAFVLFRARREHMYARSKRKGAETQRRREEFLR